MAFYIADQTDITTHIISKLEKKPDDERLILARLIYVWKTSMTTTSAEIAGTTEAKTEEEDPLPIEEVTLLHEKFVKLYGYRLSLRATASRTLLARLAREMVAKSHAFTSATSVRPQDETSGIHKTKKTRLTPGLTFDLESNAEEFRHFNSNYHFIEHLELLLVGGHCLVGI